MKNRKIALLLAVSLLACSLAACGKKNEKETQEETTVETTEVTLEEAPYEVVYSNVDIWEEYGIIQHNAIVEIKNTGSEDMMIMDASYELVDNDGRLVSTEQFAYGYPDVIPPNGTGYIFNSVSLDKYAGTTYEANVVPSISAYKSTMGMVEYDLSAVNVYSDEFGNVNVLGNLENNTDEVASDVVVTVICFDSDGKPVLGFFEMIFDDIQPQQKCSLDFKSYIYNTDITSRIDSYEIKAYSFKRKE